MKIKAEIGISIDGKSYSYKLFESLESLSKTFSQRKTAKKLNIAHSVLNRRIKNAEDRLGFKLINSSGSGSILTKEAVELINTYQKYKNRIGETKKIVISGGYIISGLLESISYDMPFDISVYSSYDISAYGLAKRNLIDLLALDDPLIAFQNDLDFIPIAYDHLVLVTNNKLEKNIISDIKDLKCLKFVSVRGTAQRLAWNTLKENNINYTIVKEVNSEFDAFKIVKNSDSLYTFLNASYFIGDSILKDETKHVISLVNCNNGKKASQELIEYLLNEGQKKIAKQGFIPIRPWKISK